MCISAALFLKASLISEPDALDAGPTEASPKGNPFPTVNHVITVSQMAPVSKTSWLAKYFGLSVMNASKDGKRLAQDLWVAV